MAISVKDLKLLWGRSAGRCALCGDQENIAREIEESFFTSIEQAHIVAGKFNGPRGDNELPLEERDTYDNLILLCPTHHRIVDKDRAKYTIETLRRIKLEHEAAVRQGRRREGGEEFLDYLAIAQKLLELEDYEEARLSLEQASAQDRQGSRYHFLCALTILGRKSFNRIGSEDLSFVVRHLVRGRHKTPLWRPILILMLIMDLDYYELHGLQNEFGVSSSDLVEAINSARPALAEESLIAHVAVSSRSRESLKILRGIRFER